MGARRPSAPRPQPCPLSQLGRSAPRPRRTEGPKRASCSCTVQRESLLGPPTTAPTRLGSGKQRKLFSHPALCSPEGTAGRGGPWLPGPCCFAGVSGALIPLPTGSPWQGSRIGRAKAFWAHAAAMLPEPARAHSARSVEPAAQNKLLVAAFGKGKVSSGSQQQPQRASAQESKASRFRPSASALQRAQRGGAAPGSLDPAALLGVSGARNPLPTGSPRR